MLIFVIPSYGFTKIEKNVELPTAFHSQIIIVSQFFIQLLHHSAAQPCVARHSNIERRETLQLVVNY